MVLLWYKLVPVLPFKPTTTKNCYVKWPTKKGTRNPIWIFNIQHRMTDCVSRWVLLFSPLALLLLSQYTTKRAYLCIAEIFLLWFHAKWLNVSLYLSRRLFNRQLKLFLPQNHYTADIWLVQLIFLWNMHSVNICIRK